MTSEHLRTLVPSLLTQYRRDFGLRDVPISVDYLKPMMEERGWVDRIIWEEYDFPWKNIAAQVQFYRAQMGVYAGEGDYARVLFSRELNTCWRRFAICKEMFHAIIDRDNSTRITSLEGLLHLAEMLVPGPSANIGDFSPFQTENIAIVLALETLFPIEYRERYEAEYRSGNITDWQMAERFRIPEYYAKRAMYPAYMAAVRAARTGTYVDL